MRRRAAVYVRGSLADGDPVYGVSDLDLVVVTAERERVERRWAHARPLHRLVNLKAYAPDELLDAAGSNVLTAPRAIFFGDDRRNRHYSLRTRPGIGAPLADWRLVAGRDVRPAVPAPRGDARFAVAWLELQCWWRHAVWAACDATRRQGAYMCTKLVAEPVRIWLWLVHGEEAPSRTAALERALDAMPEDADVVELALRLRRNLDAAPPFEVVLPWLVEFSRRLAARIAAQTAAGTEVRLVGDARSLVDWRALVLGTFERLDVVDGDPGAADDLRRCAELERPGVVPALRSRDVLVAPTRDMHSRPFPRGTLRSVQCALTDPVTFALLDGRDTARFTDVPGWRAEDWARRSVDEQRAAGGAGPAAARAEHFARTLAAGAPELYVGDGAPPGNRAWTPQPPKSSATATTSSFSPSASGR